MPAIETGHHLTELLRSKIEQLGFALVGEMRWGYQIARDGEKVSTLDASIQDDRLNMTLWPQSHPGEVLYSCNPRLSDATLVNESVDNLEGLMRAWLVREVLMETAEFPTDYALQKWLGLTSSVRTGREKPRQLSSSQIAYRLGEGPGALIRGTTPACRDLVRTARELEGAFDRPRALALAHLAAQTPEGRDAGLGFVVRSARRAVRGRLHDYDMAWEVGSLNRAVVGLVRPRDTLSLFMDEACRPAPVIETNVAPAPSF